MFRRFKKYVFFPASLWIGSHRKAYFSKEATYSGFKILPTCEFEVAHLISMSRQELSSGVRLSLTVSLSVALSANKEGLAITANPLR